MGKFPICFLLPKWGDHPVGGYKVVYEYANRLAALGHSVTVSYAYREGFIPLFALRCLRHPVWYFRLWRQYHVARRNWIPAITWFSLDPKVQLDMPQWFSPRWARTFPKNTRFVATFIWTSMCLDRFSSKYKFYLIQGKENWGKWTIDDVWRTYRLKGVQKIAVSKWLVSCIEEAGSSAYYVPNGLDFTVFGRDVPIENRNCYEIAVMWHYDKGKRTEDLLSALEMVKSQHPALHVTAFCAQEQKEPLPTWIDFVHRPDKKRHRQIYNRAAIFASASEQEGWGLSPCEAMQCGAAVAFTDIGGHRSFAQNGKTALMSPPRNPQALAANICRLINNDGLRFRIAKAGYEQIQQFTWDRAVDGFLSVIA